VRYKDSELRKRSDRTRVWVYTLTPTVLLFLVFSIFQTPLVFSSVASMTFADLSVYTQRGFWQLVFVALLGYGVWLWVRKRGMDVSGLFSVRNLLLVFTAELLLVSMFTVHKVVVQQWIFGLKDSRVIATLGVLLACATFILCIPVLYEKIQEGVLFRMQVFLLLAFAALVSVINLERVMTVVYPINYVVEGKRYDDYSYLLTNSYDNYSEWGDILLEGLGEGVAVPPNYYWGRYHPLCEERYGFKQNYLRKHFDRLLVRYKRNFRSLKDHLRVNFREEGVFRWLEANETLVGDFYELIENNCTKH